MHSIHGYRNHRLNCHKMMVFVNLLALIVSFGVLVCHQRNRHLYVLPKLLNITFIKRVTLLILL